MLLQPGDFEVVDFLLNISQPTSKCAEKPHRDLCGSGDGRRAAVAAVLADAGRRPRRSAPDTRPSAKRLNPIVVVLRRSPSVADASRTAALRFPGLANPRARGALIQGRRQGTRRPSAYQRFIRRPSVRASRDAPFTRTHQGVIMDHSNSGRRDYRWRP